MSTTRNRGWVWKVVAGVVFAVLAIGLGYWVGKMARGSEVVGGLAATRELGAVRGWVMLVAVVGGAVGGIFLHEVGHLLGGMLVGFRFGMLAVGPVRVQRDFGVDGGPVRVRFNREWGSWGGLAACYPRAGDGNPEVLRRKFLVMLVGGPGMSLLVAVVGGGLAWWVRGEVGLVCAVVGFISLALCVATMLPVMNGAYKNDGLRIWEMLYRGDSRVVRRDLAMMAIAGAASSGARPRDWDKGLVELIATDADGGMGDCAGRYLVYLCKLDAGDVEAAGREIDRAATLVAGSELSLRAAVMNERAYFRAITGQEFLEEEKAEWGKLAPAVGRAQRLRGETAVAIASGDIEGARKLVEELRGVVGADKFERDRLAELELRVKP